MFREEWFVHEEENHLHKQSKEEKVVSKDSENINDKIADPGIAVMLFVNHNEEVLAQDCREREQTVHTDFISVPIHERRDSKKNRCKNTNSGRECSFTNKINSWN